MLGNKLCKKAFSRPQIFLLSFLICIMD